MGGQGSVASHPQRSLGWRPYLGGVLIVRRVAILVHPRSDEAYQLGNRTQRLLSQAGIAVDRTRRRRGEDASLSPDTDLLVAIGGDGTVLRAQRLAVPCHAPVLGVAAGRLGFLAEVAPRDLDAAIARVLKGEYSVEHRRLIEVTHIREGKSLGVHTALNDAVLSRGRTPRSLWIAVTVDGARVANYVADGIIAATATGSTAYSLAAGGPILAPDLPNILLTPIAAHLSFVQSLVLSERSHVELSLVRSQDAALSMDGQVDVQVAYGDRVVITSSVETARFVRLTPPSHFYSQLVARLQHNLARS